MPFATQQSPVAFSEIWESELPVKFDAFLSPINVRFKRITEAVVPQNRMGTTAVQIVPVPHPILPVGNVLEGDSAWCR